ncbi:orotidine-5'-phosphate decarboxylase [Planctobacterium marinum]|uniref:Orotidine 5'-phosphate decarboxylase n=1 Tax=Planctobacterium marinum TaxID=1631968 RepID=A0AA48HQ59_9ALTE|nr:orotidine 5'-phosphate decarboxylase [Planctobacterium marinum]
MHNSKVIVALDYNEKEKAIAFVDSVTPDSCKLKVGKEMFTLFGPDFVKELVGRGFDVFLDLKFHDIPNTVAKACAAAAELGVWMINVHASGGSKMMQAAKEALAQYDKPPKLIAVTVLTSMDAEQLSGTGVTTDIQSHVEHLAKLTKESGLEGVVCSAMEAKSLKALLGTDFTLVTPGIRPQGSATGDQSRVVTPQQAVADGVDYMVIGRPITQSPDPLQTLKEINASVL